MEASSRCLRNIMSKTQKEWWELQEHSEAEGGGARSASLLRARN